MNKRMPSRERDPHAHVIQTPGRRLMQRIPLEFVWNKVNGRGARSPNASLNLVSFIDFLVVTVIFLLMSFSASGECPGRDAKIPDARNVEEAIDAPMVVVSGEAIFVDGVLAGSTRSISENGRMEKVPELFALLKGKRELWMQVQPNRPFPGECTLAIDQEEPAVVVKSVFQTAAFAGYPRVSFLVHKLDGIAP